MPVTINGTTGITTPALVNGTALSFRNKIINGNFDIWQRGTSLASGTGGRFLADRFLNASVGSTHTVSQQLFSVGQTNVPNNPKFFHRIAVSSVAGVGNYSLLAQKIESVRTLAGKTATLSFYAKSDTNKSISVEFRQSFGTGGTPSSDIDAINVEKLNLTTSWQKFTVTVNIPSITGKTLGADNNDFFDVVFWFDAGSNFNSRTNSLGQQSGTFDIAQVQLEEGSVATPFENRPIGTELALCQRYYQKTYSIDIAPASITDFGGLYSVSASTGLGNAYVNWRFIQFMRATPTVTTYNPNTGTTGTWRQGATNITASSSGLNNNGVVISNGAIIVANSGLLIHATAEAEL